MKIYKDGRQKGLIALIILAFIWASMGIYSRYLSIGFSILQQVYLRLLAGLLISLLVFHRDIHSEKIKKIPLREWGLLLVRAVSYYGFGLVLLTYAYLTTKYSNVVFIGSIPMSAVLAFILLKEKFTWTKTFLVLTAFIGVILIAVKDYSSIFIWGKGEFITFVTTVFFSLSQIARKWHSNLLNNKELAVLVLFLSFLMVCITSLLIGEGLPTSHWHIGLLLVVIIAGASNAAIQFLINYGYQHVEAVVASNVLTLEAFFGVLLSIFVYKELPVPKELVGGIFIVISVIGINKIQEKE